MELRVWQPAACAGGLEGLRCQAGEDSRVAGLGCGEPARCAPGAPAARVLATASPAGGALTHSAAWGPGWEV